MNKTSTRTEPLRTKLQIVRPQRTESQRTELGRAILRPGENRKEKSLAMIPKTNPSLERAGLNFDYDKTTKRITNAVHDGQYITIEQNTVNAE